MKKTLLLLFIASSSVAYLQKPFRAIDENSVAKDNRNIKFNGLETLGTPFLQNTNRTWSFTSEVIGQTVYDLQTNSSIQRRLVNHGDGTLSGTWIMDLGSSPWSTRGAGYNYYDGSTWGAHPTTRIETTRNGWPALATSGGNEIVVSHSGVGGLTLNIRNTKGTGTWNEKIIPTNTGQNIFWPRMAIGGANDSTIHIVAIAGDTSFYVRGLQRPMLYYRSKDLGNTWDIVDSLIPAFDTTNYLFHNGDNYSIDARGNVVAISYFPGWNDLITVKSTDNGNTWTTHIVNDMPMDKYQADAGIDLDSNSIQDSTQFFTTDGSGSVIIDDNDQVHVFFGGDFVVDWDLTDGGTSHFPLTDVLGYWNESFGNDSVVSIAQYEDKTGDDTVIVGDLNGGAIANNPDYRVSGLSMPSVGMSANGSLFVAYAAFSEIHTNGTQSYRHIYVIKSNDHGNTWSDPADFTPDFDFNLEECVYPSVAKLVDGNVHLTYQRDQTPGTHLITTSHVASLNDIVYMAIDTTLSAPVASVKEITSNYELSVFPNPTKNELNIKISSLTNTKENVSIQIIDAIGRNITSISKSINGASELVTLNVSNLKNGAYSVILKTEKTVVTKVFVKN